MAVISKDLGAVTAYAAAVNRGYTGTKEEFETLMASYATVAQQAAESAQSAEQSAQSASGSATDAQTAQGTAQQAATDAQTAQAWAQGYAQSAQQSAQSASQSAIDAESAKNTAVNAVDGFAAGAQQALDGVNHAGVNWKSLAQAKALDSEAYALGTRDGEDVGSSDPAYHNNAKWYALTAATDATTASDAAQTATTKAGEAQASAEAAAESARTLTIDATLTQAGQAADAKKTGDDLGEIRSSGTKNLFNDDAILLFDGVSYSNGVFSGAANKFTPNILMQTGFEPNTQYIISLYGKNTGEQTAGYGLGVKINYTDNTYGTSFFQNSQTGDFGRLVVSSAADRTISNVQFTYNSSGANVWSVKNIQIEKGASATDYVPYFTGHDRIARKKADDNADAISAAETDLDKANTTIDKIETALGKSANLFNKASVENGKYYSGIFGNAPELKSNANFCAILIDVKPNTVYTRNFTDFASYEVNENGLVTGSYSAATFTTSATTKAITLSVNLTHKDDFMLVEGSELPSSYEPYGSYANIPEQERIYEVGTGKPFTTFTACIESLQGHAEQKTILVYAGTYDIFEEIGGADYAATIPSGANWRDVSVVVPPNTKIIGVGDVVFEFLPESSEMPAPARGTLSALNVSGNVEIENIKIKAQNCHYCIHDETSSLAEFNNVTHKYKNVECIKYSGGDAQAFAAGFQQGGKYDFEGCLFKSEQGKAFSMHNSSTGGATINIKDCVIITTTSAVAVDFINVSGQQVRNIANLCGCYLENNGGTKRLSITGGSVNTFDVTCTSCTDVGDTTIDIAGNIYPIKQYNKFSTI